ncbi:hypothetical protein SAMN04515692_101304 [Leifsonia sp. CL147]|nr:hypothetical protein SAMN04515694_101175 [Leifsonia sp. CL154]SFL21454.1 hypothetical protein SAMN04515692_101304 [Leifsonia sp. CL147]
MIFDDEAHTVRSGVPDRAPMSNPAGLALIVLGAVAVVLGGILWGVGGNQLKHDQDVTDLTHAIGLDNGINLPATSSAVDADNAMIWWGIALVILGVLLLVARLVIAAAQPRTQTGPAHRPSLPERNRERGHGGQAGER